MALFKRFLLLLLPFGISYSRFKKSKILPNGYWSFLMFKLGVNKVYWPKEKTCLVSHPRNIYVGKNCKIGRPGTYIQGAGGVIIEDYVRFGPNVGILSSNHDLYDRDSYNTSGIKIGAYSWIGMNAIVLAGVELGPSTIVGGGSIVTKSFPEGYCVIAGNPAKVIKRLDPERVVMPHYLYEYYGYIPSERFEQLRNKYIDI